MDWFNILKEQRQVARNVQSFKPIQLDKPININKPEKDCVTKLIDYLRSKYSGSKHIPYAYMAFPSDHIFYEGNENSSFLHLPVERRKNIPNEVYCQVLDHFKSLKPEDLKNANPKRYAIQTVGPNLEIHYILRGPGIVRGSYNYKREEGYYPLLGFIIKEEDS